MDAIGRVACSLALVLPAMSLPAVLRVQNSMASSNCARGSGPSLLQLQDLTRKFYPGFVMRAKAPARVAVGFVLDSTCDVLRHGAAFLPDTAYSEDLIITVFPDIVRRGELAGIGNAVPQDGMEVPKLVVTYIVLRPSRAVRP